MKPGHSLITLCFNVDSWILVLVKVVNFFRLFELSDKNTKISVTVIRTKAFIDANFRYRQWNNGNRIRRVVSNVHKYFVRQSCSGWDSKQPQQLYIKSCNSPCAMHHTQCNCLTILANIQQLTWHSTFRYNMRNTVIIDVGHLLPFHQAVTIMPLYC